MVLLARERILCSRAHVAVPEHGGTMGLWFSNKLKTAPRYVFGKRETTRRDLGGGKSKTKKTTSQSSLHCRGGAVDLCAAAAWAAAGFSRLGKELRIPTQTLHKLNTRKCSPPFWHTWDAAGRARARLV